jgi:pimeloyl-ACP methyl ester carboxylesterase
LAARVASLTLMMSTPDLSVPTRATTGLPQLPASRLPPPLPAYLDYIDLSASNVAHTPGAMLDKMVDGWRAANGAANGFDEARTRILMRRALDRTTQPLGMLNHLAATLSARDLSAALSRLRVPTLIIHGEDDPLLPLAHGETLARLISGATLLRVPGMGHMLDSRHLTLIMPRVIAHLQNAMRAAFAKHHT